MVIHKYSVRYSFVNNATNWLFIVRLTQQKDVKLSYVQLIKLHVSTPWGHLQAYKI